MTRLHDRRPASGRARAARRALAALVAAQLAASAAAQPLQEAVAAPEGAEVTLRHGPERDAYAVPVRPAGEEGPITRPVEGAVTRLAFRLEEGATLGLARRIQDRLAPLGFETVLDCAGEGCGGYDFRFALDVAAAPAMAVSLADFRQLTMRRPSEDATDWASLLVSRLGGRLHAQLVLVEDAAAAPDATPVPVIDAAAAPPAPETPAPATPLPEPPTPAAAPALEVGGAALAATAEGLLTALTGDGRAVLTGLDFETGGARPTPGSTDILDAAAEALRAEPALSVAVVGHSDDVGGYAVNRRVSGARAQAVVEALVARGVDRARLEAHGAAWLAPLASNATGAGRALNRRVELVAR
jgi:OOP family OmpA-OmpF porin